MQYKELIMIVVGILAMYELKARIDLIAFSQIKDKKTRRTFHLLAWAYIAIVGFIISFEFAHKLNLLFCAVLGFIATARASYFPLRLNKLRGKTWDHLGTEGYDAAVRWLFRNNTKVYFIIMYIITVILAGLSWYLIE